MKNIKFYGKPELENHCLLAARPSVGYTATGVIGYLRKKLKATLLTEIKPEDFFYLTDVWIGNDEIILPELPKSALFYWKNREVRRDLIVFLGEIPYHTTQTENPRSSQGVLSILTKMLGIEINMEEINLLVRQTEERLTEFIKAPRKLERPMSSEEIEAMKKDLKINTEFPQSAKDRIENLFKQAAKDRSKAIELKAELDKGGVFGEYEDRFFDLFKNGHH